LMNKAKNFGAFTKAMEMQAVPLFNTVYADDAGNIMIHSGGKVPKRDMNLDWKPPIKAATSDYMWQEIMPYSSLPHVENPECGYVYNANNTPLHCTGDTCEWNEHFPGVQTFMYNRGERFEHLMQEHNGPFTEADLKRIKYDMSYHPDGSYAQRFDTLFNLDPSKYPDIADAIEKMKAWSKTGVKDDPHAALALVVHDELGKEVGMPFGFLMIRNARIKEAEAVSALRKAKKFLVKKHGSLDIPLGNVQRIIRGEKSLPAHGLKEVPRATDIKLHDKRKGVYKVTGGDGYIQIARFGNGKPEIRSVNIYGASNRPESPHFSDQMEMFNAHEFKAMPLERSEVEKMAERVYHPGQ
jgi:acyl-homoserine-lactone acylase